MCLTLQVLHGQRLESTESSILLASANSDALSASPSAHLPPQPLQRTPTPSKKKKKKKEESSFHPLLRCSFSVVVVYTYGGRGVGCLLLPSCFRVGLGRLVEEGEDYRTRSKEEERQKAKRLIYLSIYLTCRQSIISLSVFIL